MFFSLLVISKRGFSLTEVVIALGICAFALLAMLGLLATGFNTNRDTVSRTEAAGIARAVAADLRLLPREADRSFGGQSERFDIPAPSGIEASSSPVRTLYFGEDLSKATASAVTTANASRYRVDVAYGGRSSTNQAVPVSILVTWPALGNNAGSWPEKYEGSFESVTALAP